MAKVPIAKRKFYLLGDKTRSFTLEIFSPEKFKDGDSYQCELRIRGGAPEGLDYLVVGGNDSIQALLLAISASKGMLEALNDQYLDSKLRYLEDSDTSLHLDLITSRL